MKLKTKKIIAREGLIFIGFSLCTFVLHIILTYFEPNLSMSDIVFIFWIGILYGFHLLIRFIIWAIKTLRK